MATRGKKEFIGFYDKNGKPLRCGDIVMAYRHHYVGGDGPAPKRRPDKIRCYWKIQWSDSSPEYWFREIGVHIDDHAYSHYHKYRQLPYFESKAKSMFWKEKDGKIANKWHYDLIKHLPAKVRYLSMWEAEKINPKDMPEIRISWHEPKSNEEATTQ